MPVSIILNLKKKKKARGPDFSRQLLKCPTSLICDNQKNKRHAIRCMGYCGSDFVWFLVQIHRLTRSAQTINSILTLELLFVVQEFPGFGNDIVV